MRIIEATTPEQAVTKLAQLASEEQDWTAWLDDRSLLDYLLEREARVRTVVDVIVCVAPGIRAIIANPKPADCVDPREIDF